MFILLNPPSPAGRVSNKEMMGGFGQCYPGDCTVKVPPLDLVYTASVLQETGVNFKVIECLGADISAENLPEALSRLPEKIEIIFIRTSTSTYGMDLELAGKLKELTGALTVFFGPHADINAETIIKERHVDGLVLGEPEYTVPDICLKGFKGTEGIWYKENGTVVKKNKKEPLRDLDKLPFPAWELFPYKAYNVDVHLPVKGTTLFILTSRGCPFFCDYCPYPVAQGSQYRKRSAENVLAELKELAAKYRVKNILIRDAEFTLDKSRAVDICNGIINAGLKINFRCETRADTLDEELLTLMARAGFTGLNMGIESASERVIERSGRKQTDREHIARLVEKCRQLKINVFCFYIIGLPGDDLESIIETLNFAERLNADVSQFTIATPYPGTKLYAWAKEHDFIENFISDNITGYEAMLKNEDLSREQILALRNDVQARVDSIRKYGSKPAAKQLGKNSPFSFPVLRALKKLAKKEDRIVLYGARGVSPEALKKQGFNIAGIIDEIYFGEKVDGFTVMRPLVLSAYKAQVLLVSPLKRSANIKQYLGGIKVAESLVLAKNIAKKLKNMVKK